MAYKKVPASVKSFKELELDDFVFVGFMGLQDPLRPETIETLRISERANVRTVMITGDHKLTAQSIAKDLGLAHKSENIMTGEELSRLSAGQLRKQVPKISVYARVSPEDKLKIVRAWQERGAVVAMTGDGVNDAPALKKADIGVAVGSGTDVSKETADLILLDDDFKTIVSAIRQGRVIYDNVKKVILYFLSDSFTEVILITVSLVLGWPLPVLAAQILWVNIVDDGFPALALTQDPEEPENMTEQPEPKNMPVLDLERKLLIAAISIATAAGTLLMFSLYWHHFAAELAHARSMAFVLIGVDSLLYIFAVKSMRHPIWKTKLFDNKFLIFAVLFGIAMQAVAVYVPFLQHLLKTVPLSLKDWGYVGFLSLGVIVVIEIIKGIFFGLQKKHKKLAVNN
jgi:Ca2+-transporting ATPase